MTETASPPLPQLAPERPASREFDRALVRGIAWTGLVRGGTQALRWGSTLLIARLLTPADYGLVGMAMVYLGLIQLVNEFGLGAAIVQHRELDSRQIARLGGLAALSGAFFLSLTVILSGPLAGFFREPRVEGVVVALSATFVIRGFQVVPRAVLARDLRFRELAWIDGAEAVVLAGGTLLLAASGFGFWALVCGALGASAMGLVLSLWFSPQRVAWPRDLRGLAGPLGLGWRVICSRGAWYAYSNADFAVVGRMLGAVALGAYSVGWSLAAIPVERVSTVVGRVTPGIFSSLQHDLAGLRRYLLRLTEGIALITFPVSFGLALVADDFVLLILGEQWRAAIVPFRVLIIAAAFRSLTPLMPQLLIAMGHARTAMWASIWGAVLLPVLFVAGSRWGTTGVSIAWLVGFPLVTLPVEYRRVFRTLRLPTREYLSALRPATDATLVMVIGILGLRSLPQPLEPGLTRLVAEALAGGALYLATLYLLHRARVDAFRAGARLFRS